MTSAEKPQAEIPQGGGMRDQIDQILAVVTALTVNQQHTPDVSMKDTLDWMGFVVGNIEKNQLLVTERIIDTLTAKLDTMGTTPPSGDLALLLADCRDTIT